MSSPATEAVPTGAEEAAEGSTKAAGQQGEATAAAAAGQRSSPAAPTRQAAAARTAWSASGSSRALGSKKRPIVA